MSKKPKKTAKQGSQRQAEYMARIKDGGFQPGARRDLFHAGRDALPTKVETFCAGAVGLRDALVEAGKKKPSKKVFIDAGKEADRLRTSLTEIIPTFGEPWLSIDRALMHISRVGMDHKQMTIPAEAKDLERLASELVKVVVWDAQSGSAVPPEPETLPSVTEPKAASVTGRKPKPAKPSVTKQSPEPVSPSLTEEAPDEHASGIPIPDFLK